MDGGVYCPNKPHLGTSPTRYRFSCTDLPHTIHVHTFVLVDENMFAYNWNILFVPINTAAFIFSSQLLGEVFIGGQCLIIHSGLVSTPRVLVKTVDRYLASC